MRLEINVKDFHPEVRGGAHPGILNYWPRATMLIIEVDDDWKSLHYVRISSGFITTIQSDIFIDDRIRNYSLINSKIYEKYVNPIRVRDTKLKELGI